MTSSLKTNESLVFEPHHGFDESKLKDDYDPEMTPSPVENSAGFSAEEVDKKNAAKYTQGIVPTSDDPSLPALTFRSIVLGTFFNIILAVACAIFHFRTNTIAVPSFIATLLSYPMGVFMEYALPKRTWFNPGPFNMKEHVLITVIASAGGGLPYGLDNVVVQYKSDLMGNPNVNVWNSLAWVLCSQLIGFGIAGSVRRFLIRPSAMLWPSVLSTVALFVGFHKDNGSFQDQEDDIDESGPVRQFKLSRFTFFWIVAVCSFAWAWLPSFVAPVLLSIPIVCLASSTEQWKFLGSGQPKTGPGIGVLTLDWNYLYGTQMTSPYWATCNIIVGNIIWWWVITPIIHYTNAFGRDTSLYIPKTGFNHTINTVSLFSSKTNTTIPALNVMDPNTYDLNTAAYEIHAPLRLASGFVVSYGVSFMALAATVTHVIAWYGKNIYRQAKEAFKQMETNEDDVHNRLMSNYSDVSELSYMIFLVVMIVITSIVCEFTPFHLPWYYILLAIGLNFLFIIPIGAVTAIAGTSIGLNILSQFVIGFIAPGKSIWVMSFKSIGTNGIVQAINLLQDLKLGHYMHISPKSMILAQIYGTVLGAILNTVTSFLVMNVWFKNLLGEADAWNYSGYRTFYSAAAIWGSIGPARFFGIGSLYQSLLWFFALGVILPLIPFYANKIWPSERWHLINVPLLSAMYPAQYQQNWILTTFLVATASQFYAFNYHYDWFQKYNYIMSIGMDVGANSVALLTAILEVMELKMPDWAGTHNLEELYCQRY